MNHIQQLTKYRQSNTISMVAFHSIKQLIIVTYQSSLTYIRIHQPLALLSSDYNWGNTQNGSKTIDIKLISNTKQGALGVNTHNQI